MTSRQTRPSSLRLGFPSLEKEHQRLGATQRRELGAGGGGRDCLRVCPGEGRPGSPRLWQRRGREAVLSPLLCVSVDKQAVCTGEQGWIPSWDRLQEKPGTLAALQTGVEGWTGVTGVEGCPFQSESKAWSTGPPPPCRMPPT